MSFSGNDVGWGVGSISFSFEDSFNELLEECGIEYLPVPELNYVLIDFWQNYLPILIVSR